MIKTPESLHWLKDVNVASPTDNYILKYDAATKLWGAEAESGGGVTDHGELDGLSDDDHSQYHTDARGDARYLYRENTNAFTPDGNYEPATKKYVDDSVSGAGSGDMTKAVYDLDDDGVVDDAEDSQKLDGSTKAQVQAHTFLVLTDVPATYTGYGGKYVKVKATEDGLEFAASPSNAVSSIKQLDSPVPDISGSAELVV